MDAIRDGIAVVNSREGFGRGTSTSRIPCKTESRSVTMTQRDVTNRTDELFMNLNSSSSFHPLPINAPHDVPDLIRQTQRPTNTHNDTFALPPPSTSLALETQRRRTVEHAGENACELGAAGFEGEAGGESVERGGGEDGGVEPGAGVVYVNAEVGVKSGGEEVGEEGHERTETGWRGERSDPALMWARTE